MVGTARTLDLLCSGREIDTIEMEDTEDDAVKARIDMCEAAAWTPSETVGPEIHREPSSQRATPRGRE
jgi:hypothetical protein